ncbi:MAG: hypothetical protein ACLQM8_25855 [Limisphaerales bacterium]
MTAEELKAEVEIEWDRMREGLDLVSAILVAFRNRVAAHLGKL